MPAVGNSFQEHKLFHITECQKDTRWALGIGITLKYVYINFKLKYKLLKIFHLNIIEGDHKSKEGMLKIL